MIGLLSWLLAVSHCQGCSSGTSIPDREEGKNLMVFMSFSAPLETWQDLSAQLEKTDGLFVVRGLPEDSFELFAQKVLELKLMNVRAPIDIDPDAFERYKIEAIPAFVLEEDKIEGNLRLDAALAQMAEKGDASHRAKEILEQLHR